MKEGKNYKKLKDVAKYYNGLTYKPTDVTDDGVLVLRSSNIQDNKLSLLDQVKVSIKLDEKLKVHKGDLIMCSRNGSKSLIGKVAIIPEEIKDLTFGTFMMIFKSEYNPFLYYFFLSDVFKKQIWKGEATMINQITRYMLDEVSVPVPPLPEQQRIVEYLDTQFAKIEALKANAAKQLQAAKDLFQSALKDLMTPKDGWSKKQFGEVCDYRKIQDKWKDIPYIGLEHIEAHTGKLLGSINSNEVESSTFKFQQGDVLYGRLRPYLQKVIIAPFDGCCSTEIFPIKSEVINHNFLKYWLLSDEVTTIMNESCSGCRMPRANMTDFRKETISFPQQSEQLQLVDSLNSITQNIHSLEENYEQTITLCSDLKQSLLKQIFE